MERSTEIRAPPSQRLLSKGVSESKRSGNRALAIPSSHSAATRGRHATRRENADRLLTVRRAPRERFFADGATQERVIPPPTPSRRRSPKGTSCPSNDWIPAAGPPA